MSDGNSSQAMPFTGATRSSWTAIPGVRRSTIDHGDEPVLLALSGMALFYPKLFFLPVLFGGGQTTRMIHPWIGVVLFFSFLGPSFAFGN